MLGNRSSRGRLNPDGQQYPGSCLQYGYANLS